MGAMEYGSYPKIPNTLWNTFCLNSFPCASIPQNTWWKDKQQRSWTNSHFSGVIWVYTVCLCHFIKEAGVRKFRTITTVMLLRVKIPFWDFLSFWGENLWGWLSDEVFAYISLVWPRKLQHFCHFHVYVLVDCSEGSFLQESAGINP